jgi:hypothetical protein
MERPDWREFTEQLVRLKAARVRSARDRAAKAARDQEKVSAWRAERELAIQRGDPVPPVLPLEVLELDLAGSAVDGRVNLSLEHEYALRLRDVRDQQHALLGRIAPEIEHDARDVEAELLTRTLKTRVSDLEPIRAELEQLVLTVRTARFVWHGPDPHGEKAASLTRQQITLIDLVEAATGGWSLLAPVPRSTQDRTLVRREQLERPTAPKPREVVHVTVRRTGPTEYQARQRVIDTSGVDMSREPADPAQVKELAEIHARQREQVPFRHR